MQEMLLRRVMLLMEYEEASRTINRVRQSKYEAVSGLSQLFPMIATISTRVGFTLVSLILKHFLHISLKHRRSFLPIFIIVSVAGKRIFNVYDCY